MKFNRSCKEKQNAGSHSPLHHMLHMIICCGLPAIIIMMLPFIAGFSPAIAGFLGLIAPFICPLMMGGMFFMMFAKGKSSCCENSGNDGKDRQLTQK